MVRLKINFDSITIYVLYTRRTYMIFFNRREVNPLFSNFQNFSPYYFTHPYQNFTIFSHIDFIVRVYLTNNIVKKKRPTRLARSIERAHITYYIFIHVNI